MPNQTQVKAIVNACLRHPDMQRLAAAIPAVERRLRYQAQAKAKRKRTRTRTRMPRKLRYQAAKEHPHTAELATELASQRFTQLTNEGQRPNWNDLYKVAEHEICRDIANAR